jgi:hypothetical protein
MEHVKAFERFVFFVLRSYVVFLAVSLIVCYAAELRAERFQLLHRPLDVYALFSQNVQYSPKDAFDTEQGVNAAIWSAILEGAYEPAEDFNIFSQVVLTGDLVYELKESDDSWTAKGFGRSRSELALDDQYWQIFKELHATLTPGPFLVRLGKQIISWGQTDGFRLMDQINPLDFRRGFSDVEFETTVIPVWLIRADYSPSLGWTWLQDLNFQLWYNPNADFIPTQNISPGNNEGGVWAPFVELPAPISGKTLLGAGSQNIEKPKEWTEGHEIGFRIQGTIRDTLASLNVFYGRENEPLLRTAGPPRLELDAVPGINLLHPVQEGFFPRLRFVGGTLSRDLSGLRRLFLGISPVLRVEAFYAFDNGFLRSLPLQGGERFERHDEIRWSVGLDWKVRLPILSPSGIVVSPQFFHRHVSGVSSGTPLLSPSGAVEHDNYSVSLMLRTAYLNERMPVSLFWFRDITGKSGYWKPSIGYLWDAHWSVEAGALFFDGERNGEGFQVFDHKDFFYLNVSYKWG